jgi:hypothetical protein
MLKIVLGNCLKQAFVDADRCVVLQKVEVLEKGRVCDVLGSSSLLFATSRHL